MADTVTDSLSTLAGTLPNYWKRRWLRRHMAQLVYDEWGQQEPIPMGSGRTIIWNQLLNPAVGYVVGEGATPGASAISSRKVSATLTQYGDNKAVSDIVINSACLPIISETVDALGYGGALTKDNFISDKIGFGSAMSTSVANAASAFTPSVFSQGFPVYSGASDTLFWPNSTNQAVGFGTEVFSTIPAISHLRGARTKLLTYNAITFPDGNFRGIVHVNYSAQIRSDSLWPTWNAYSNRVGALVKGQMGVIEGILFKESSVAFNKTLAASAWAVGYLSLGGTLYGSLIFGVGAYGVTKLAGKDVTVTVLPADKVDKSDPLGQRAYFSYKFDIAAAILNPSAGVIALWYKTN